MTRLLAPLRSRLPELLLCALLALYGTLYLHNLGSHPYFDWDEAIYTQVVKESIRSGNSLDFTYQQQPWFEKPPLMFWVTEASFRLLGESEFAARLPVALFSLGIVALTYMFTAELFRSKAAGLWAAISFSIIYNFAYFAFFLGLDLPAGFFMLLALYGFWKARDDSRWFYVFWGALALGMLTKSFVGLLPVAAIALYSLLFWKWEWLRQRHFYYGALVFSALAAPWHIRETLLFGASFWKSYLGYHMVSRFLQPLEGHAGTFWHYVPMLLRQNTLFALFFSLSVIYFLFRAARRKEPYAYVLIGAAVLFAFFSAASTKRGNYIAVLYPLLAAMMGALVADGLSRIPRPWLKSLGAAVVAGTFLPLGIQQHTFILAYWGHSQLDIDARTTGDYLRTHHIGLPVVSDAVWYVGPTFYYYSERQASVATPDTAIRPEHLTPANRILHTQTRNLYLVDGKIYITR